MTDVLGTMEDDEMHTQNIQKQFGIRVPTYNTAANWMLNQELIQAHIRAAGTPDNTKNTCLELCCGTGILGKAFTQHGWEVTGIDLTQEMVDESGKYFKAVQGSVEDMPFPDHAFDVAILRQAYMLVNGPKALKEIRRVLKDDGVFILSQSVAFSEEDEPEYRQVQLARHINMLTYYTTESLKTELEENGFSVEDTLFLRGRESVDKWLRMAIALSPDVREKIRAMIADASEGYKRIRNVQHENNELHEDWQWAIFVARVTR